MEGPLDTPYFGKFFLLRFSFGPDFPTTPPTAHFLTKVYHPNVDSTTGAICVNTLKRDWKPEHTMKHCLAVIRCLLLEPFPESSLNEVAGKLFMESYEEYCKRARLHTDVHGRSHSIVAGGVNNNKTVSSSSFNLEQREETRVLQNASHNTSGNNPIGIRTTNNIPDTTKKAIKTKTTMKKSLKRL